MNLRNSCFALLAGIFIAFPVLAGVSLKGNAVQGGLMEGRVEPGSTVSVDGTKVRVSAEGVFLIAFGRDHGKSSRFKVTSPEGSVLEQVIDVTKREYRIQRIDGLPKRKVVPNKKDLERIRKESAMIGKARRRDDKRADFLSGWIWPVEGPISGVYGSQRILNGKPRRPHFGVDIAMPVGTPVKAPADGVVTFTHPDMFFSGGTMIVDHGHRLSSSFLHLNKILVKEGERVKQGDVIAEVGKTGRVTGAHLDWRMNYHKHRIDPQLLVPPMPEKAVKTDAKAAMSEKGS
ncbi:MAG: M23 family metallopeptidase [Candidatus Sedimenticola sp. 20ELBAFRAG]